MAKSFFLSLIPPVAAALSTPASAQASAAAPVCPARYEIMTGNLCIHVVFAATAGGPSYTSAIAAKAMSTRDSGSSPCARKWLNSCRATTRAKSACASLLVESSRIASRKHSS